MTLLLLKRVCHIVLCLWALGLCAGNAAAQGDVFQFERPIALFSSKGNEPKFKKIGELQFSNGVSVPAYSVTLLSGGDSESETMRPENLTIPKTLNPQIAGLLAAFAQPWGWILAPKTWKPLGGAIGANGSVSVIFAPNDSGQSYIRYYNPSACIGCAQTSASLFFKNARESAKKNDFLYYDRTNVPIKMINLRPTLIAYSVKLDGGNPIDRLAYYDEKEDFPYFRLEVSLPEQDRALASAVLNLYVPNKGQPKEQYTK